MIAMDWSLGSPNSRSGYLAWSSTEAQLIPNKNSSASFRCSSVRLVLLLWALSHLQLTSGLCLKELPEFFELTATSLA